MNCDINSKPLETLVSSLPHLEILNLSKCNKVSDNCIFALADTCRGLKYLNIKLCRRLSDKALTKVVTQLTDLESLVMEDIPKITDSSFKDFRCPSLRKLNVDYCCKLTPHALLSIIHVATNLSNISIQHVDTTNANEEFAEFIGKCTNAFRLNIFNAPNVLNAKILEKIGELGGLKELSLGSNIVGVTESPHILEALERLFERLPYLERLSLGRVSVSKKVLSKIAKHCCLKELSLRWCSSPDESALMEVANSLHFLEILTVAEERPCLITCDVVKCIVENCKQLIELKFISCTGVNDNSIASLSKLTKLRKIVLSGSSITNTSIPVIIECQNLIELDISHCRFLTFESVHLMTQKPKASLRKLSLDGYLWMMQGHVVKLVDTFPLLTNLYTSDCRFSGKKLVIEDMDLSIHTMSTTLTKEFARIL